VSFAAGVPPDPAACLAAGKRNSAPSRRSNERTGGAAPSQDGAAFLLAISATPGTELGLIAQKDERRQYLLFVHNAHFTDHFSGAPFLSNMK